jgi:hypothetical protein
MDLQQIETRLASILEESKPWIPPEQLSDMTELVRAGEPGVAFENLCTQLFEFDAVIPPDLRERLRRLGEQMGIASDFW